MNDHRPPRTNDARQWLAQAGFGLLLKLGLLLLGMLAAVFFLAWLAFGGGVAPRLETGAPVSAADASGALVQPGLVAMQVDGVTVGTVQRLDAPQALTIDGFQLDVAGQYLTAAALWQAGDVPANQASWLQHTIVNYVFRLPGSRAYRDMLETAAAAGGTVTLETAQGRQLTFALAPGSGQAPAAQAQAVQQNRPAITLIWVDAADAGATYALSGAYVPGEPPAGDVGSGQAADAADAGSAAPPLLVRLDAADLQEAGRQLLVRGTLTNRGLAPQQLDAADLQLAAGGLVGQILSVDPPLPWQVPPNNSQVAFAVTFQRLPQAEATLTIGPQDFALTFE